MGTGRPLIRANLHLSYVQVGIVDHTIPSLVSSSRFWGIWADIGQRRQLIGWWCGVCDRLAADSFSHNFPLLLTAFVLFYPASGAFVSLLKQL